MNDISLPSFNYTQKGVSRQTGAEHMANEGVESRIARLESDVSYIKRDIGDIKTDIRQIRDTDLKDIRKDMKTDFRALFAAIIAVALGLAGIMGKGFGWL
ncbi:hypothetical protein [Yersinia aldovae]|uniref:hypothetical protein n=1 Tax=Yersinia aldovae TaxID=29483 RepID=UPI0021BDC01A|nr:hypothetical protein [Yersinia aldovae]